MTAKATAILILLLSAATAAAGTSVHVSPAGDDSADGTREAPFATIARALVATRAVEGPRTIVVMEGIHELAGFVVLDERDAGLRIEGSGEARLLGGRVVRGLTREGEVFVADLKAAGITDYGTHRPLGMKVRGPAAMEVFVDGQRQELARYPNHGWLTIASVPDGRKGKTFTVDLPAERLARWAKEADPWVYGYWFHGWADSFLPLAGIDAAKKTLAVGESHHYGLAKERRFYARNLLCELDAPGEYWIDRARGRLHLLPTDGKPGEVIVSLLEAPILDISGTRDVVIEGLTIEAGRSSGVRIRDCDDVRVVSCKIRNLGDTGVEVSGGRRCRISDCEIRDTGSSGIRLSGGDRKTLTPARHVAEGNHLHHSSRIRRTYTPAVSIGGVGNIARRNLIHDAPHQAIQFHGNDHVIERNEIHHVVLETDDAGAIYTCARDFTQRGTVIRHNRLHHCGPHHAPRVPDALRTEPGVVYEPKHIHGTSLIYLDDLTGGTLVEGNVLEDAYRAILIGGGRENGIRGNLILGGNIGIWIDGRGLGWAKSHASKGGAWGLYRKFAAIGGDAEPFVTRYPGLSTATEHDPAAPVDTVAVGNIVLGAKAWKKTDGHSDPFVTFERNHAGEWTGGTPEAALGSVDREVLRTIGFEPIPFASIGRGKRPPNIVLVMADDLGYETIGANGGTSYATPCLDALAREGMRFTHAYATPLCTPSRVQLMTGKYNFRNYIGFGLLDPGERTFAHLLRDAGYRTAVAGKWQLYGSKRQRKLAGRGGSRPEEAGFDEHLLWQVDAFGPRFAHPRLSLNGDPARDYPREYGPDLFLEFIEGFVVRNRDRPFFVYYPMVLTHDPFLPTPRHPDYGEVEKHDPKYFGANVRYMDRIVGFIMKALAMNDLAEDTLLIFVGDNGTNREITSQTRTGPVTGHKGHATAAGTRVPLIASWPGTVKPGGVSDRLVDLTDFLPTLLDAAGVARPKTDGISFHGQLTGRGGRDREWVFCHYDPRWGKFEPARWVHDRDWVLVEGESIRRWGAATGDPATAPEEAARKFRAVLERMK